MYLAGWHDHEELPDFLPLVFERFLRPGSYTLILKLEDLNGGGFYRMQKFLLAPAELPKDLTWFKYEAYSTWLSGFVLLGLATLTPVGINAALFGKDAPVWTDALARWHTVADKWPCSTSGLRS